jgi:hypothetical protein
MSGSATDVQADKTTGDYVACHGVRINLDEIINKDMLTSAGIKAMRQQFQTNTPFPHLVIDRLFSPKLLELMYAELKWNDWRVAATAEEVKRGSLPNATFGPAAQIYFQTIASGWFIDILKQITGSTVRSAILNYTMAGCMRSRTAAIFTSIPILPTIRSPISTIGWS